MRADQMLVLGVDPGSRSTGLVVRQGDKLLAHQVVEVSGGGQMPSRRQLMFTLDIAVRLVGSIGDAPRPFTAVFVAVEDVNEPTPHMGIINLKGLLGTAKVLAAFEAADWLLRGHPAQVVTVPPGGNGSNVLAAYPPELVTGTERAKGLMRPAGQSAPIRHCRSAWDVAGAAPRLAALAT